MADRRRLVANLAAVGLLLALAAGVLIWQRPWSTPGPTDPNDVPADARAKIVQQFQRISAADSRAEFIEAFGGSAESHTTAREIWAAQRVLKVEDVRYRYVRGGEAVDRADGTTSARVEVSWRGGSSDARFRLRPRTDGFDVIAATNAGRDPLPLWLAGQLHVSRSSGVTVVAVDGGPRDVDVPPLAREAAARVKQIVPAASGNLTVVVPRREATAAALLGWRQSQVAHVAARTATVAGKRGIVLNPTFFAAADARVRQIYLTHEATHVLTGVVGHRIDLWVAEGFADFVALHDDRAPLSVSAGQILQRVKAEGPPKALPSRKDFDESAHGLGAAYESAWMAFRMLGERFGDAAVREFYAAAVRGMSADAAARQAFGLTVAEITADWRAYLTKSASTVS